jgi:putative FmdB family regulatory protein
MPLYEYQCDACGGRFEIIQKFSDPPPEACKVCGKGPVQRLLSSPAIQFKGSGWYITDYARKGGSEGGGESRTGETKAETKTDAAAKSDAPAKSESSSSTPAAPAKPAATSKE